MADIIEVPYFSLRPDNLVVYSRFENYVPSFKQRETYNNLNDNRNKYNEISSHSKRRLRNALSFMLYMSKGKVTSGRKVISKDLNNEINVVRAKYRIVKKQKYNLTFITLTLSGEQIHSDNEIKSKLLNHFFTVLRQKYFLKFYVWKAEKQENGNIHFHIITDKYIAWQSVRSIWNKIQNKKGFAYVDRYSCKMQEFFKKGFRLLPNDKRSYKKQYEAYLVNKANNWSDPNSTDIHAIYKIRNIASYFSKYMIKDVTKTSRVEEMKNLNERLDVLIDEKYSLSRNIFEAKKVLKSKMLLLKNKINKIKKRYKELKELGVSGRIWGQSQALSKLKSYNEVCHFDDIPDIKIIEKACYKRSFNIGYSQIISYYFNIKNTLNLTKILNEHIVSLL